MMWISFAWTTDAVIVGRKRRTRRNWTISHAEKFRGRQLVDAYNRNPRNGGQKVAEITLTCVPWRQRTRYMTMEDYELEGFAWMVEQGLEYAGMEPFLFFLKWREENVLMWVVEFDLTYLTAAGMRRKIELQGMAV